MTADASPAHDPGWALGICAEAAHRLGRHRWEMLRLSYADGLTQREIAAHLRISAAEVGAQIAAGLRVVAAVAVEGG